MKKLYPLLGLALLVSVSGCDKKQEAAPAPEATQAAAVTQPAPVRPNRPFVWGNANVYFLLTDRFNNGNPANDLMYGRQADAAPERGFQGGDIAGITAKIREGYFDKLGVDAIWLTPHVQQIPDSTDEGTGKSYGYHGYWTLDWTAVDANFGTMDDMKEFVQTAHDHGIRVLLDVVINHTGPATEKAPAWPDPWVRTSPACTYKDAPTTISCTLVANLPDIRTESETEVDLPPQLVEKWKAEGRYEQEVKELDEFFARTKLTRTPRHYIMKWHSDWIKDLGVDGFRVDTVKHTEEVVWAELKKVASETFEEWKRNNPTKAFHNDPFFMVGEVYNYGIQGGTQFDLGGGKVVNYYANGFDALISFSLKGDANKDYETLFTEYSDLLNYDALKDYTVLNYITSHDDGGPFDKERKRVFEAGTKLLLAPGMAQIYYGDETARNLIIPGTEGDATLRSFMNWDELKNNVEKNGYHVADVFEHWSKLGKFRQNNVAVGAGEHEVLADEPYTFKRTYDKNGISNKVVVALGVPKNQANSITVEGVFDDGETVKDYYSDQTAVVTEGTATFTTPYDLILIAK